ncbi:MAG: AMP-binding protein [Pseudomonadota bacterium]|nr:AMP-binding protein [Pseudomonadota bacterium]
MAAESFHMPYTAHVDGFARERLPPPHLWPEFRFDLPELQYPERINCGAVLLDDAIREGHGERVALYSDSGVWTYAQLLDRTNRIANVLIRELGVVPGNRVLLRGPNNPMLVACWLAVIKAGAIAVTTMPLLRAHELSVIADRAQVDHALCDSRFAQELEQAAQLGGRLKKILYFGNSGDGPLERMMNGQASTFDNVDTARDDVCLLAFTSGTTGTPKATMHFHRDVLVMREIVAGHLLDTGPNDIYVGSPPLGFTFGLGALLVFPLGRRAASVLVEQPTGENLLTAVQRFRATALFTSPTAYRSLLPVLEKFDIASLERCVSAGEALSKSTSDAWFAATGLRLIDGIGATELIHIFISAKGEQIRPGMTGKPLPGYQACILDPDGLPLPPGKVGRLAVKGPTGCRYLDDARQRDYVLQGWNITGDLYSQDHDGYFHFEARADDMIISSGYNIAGPEVESALLEHPAVKECAVVGIPDEARGHVVKAFVVLHDGSMGSAELAQTLQQFVKQSIAPYKYPRAIEFRTALPKTATGKLQRHALRAHS